MTLFDRTTAWNALHDPTTTAAQLAEIAGAHVEFAGAIARHPNAYPALIEWARGQAAQTAPARQTTRPRSHVVWLVAIVIYLLAPAFIDIVVVLSLGSMSFSAGNGAPLWYVLSLEWPTLIFAVAAAIAAPDAIRRAIGVASGVGAFIVYCVLDCVSLGVFSGVPQDLPWFVRLPLVAVAAALLFLAWAVTRPLVGAGYSAIAVAIVIDCVIAFVVIPAIWLYVVGALAHQFALPSSAQQILEELVLVIVQAIEIAVVVVVALALNRVAERAAVLRASAAQGPA